MPETTFSNTFQTIKTKPTLVPFTTIRPTCAVTVFTIVTNIQRKNKNVRTLQGLILDQLLLTVFISFMTGLSARLRVVRRHMQHGKCEKTESPEDKHREVNGSKRQKEETLSVFKDQFRAANQKGIARTTQKRRMLGGVADGHETNNEAMNCARLERQRCKRRYRL